MQIERRCRITLVENPVHLRASHCKPWRDSTDHERLEGENGLLLSKRTVLAVWTGLISVGILPSGHSGCVHLEVRWMLRIPQ